MTIPFFAPLSGYQVSRNGAHTVRRNANVVGSPGGMSRVRSFAKGPIGLHPVVVECTTEAEIDQLFAWHQTALGACNPFWLPSFQRDLVPLAPIGPSDVEFDIQARDYTNFEFPDLSRRSLAFVFGDTDILQRTVIDAVDNLDGTETITIDQSLARTFTQQRNTGISFCWYVRCVNDALAFRWKGQDQGTAEFQVVELRNSVFIDVWTLFEVFGAGSTSIGPGEFPVIVTGQWAGQFGDAGGFFYLERNFQVPPGITLDIDGTYQVSANPNPFNTGLQFVSSVTSVGVFAPNPPAIDTDIPFSISIPIGIDGMVKVRVGRFDLEALAGPIAVRLTSMSFDI